MRNEIYAGSFMKLIIKALMMLDNIVGPFIDRARPCLIGWAWTEMEFYITRALEIFKIGLAQVRNIRKSWMLDLKREAGKCDVNMRLKRIGSLRYLIIGN